MHVIKVLETGLCLLSVFLMANGLIGYDCSSPPYNTRTYSRLEVEKCEDMDSRTTVKLVEILVLELPKPSRVKAEQCNINMKVYLQSCDNNENLTMAESYAAPHMIKHANINVCQEMMRPFIRRPTSYNTTEDRIGPGSIHADGTCDGVEFSGWRGWWSNVITHERSEYVTHTLEVPVSNGNVKFPSGTVCKFKDEWCWNEEEGVFSWEIIENYDCPFSRRNSLYSGHAIKVFTGNDERTIKYVTIEGPSIEHFSFTAERRKTICEKKAYTSDDGRLLIVEGDSKTERDDVKLLKIIKQMVELQSLHDRMEKFECELNRKDLEYALTIAPFAPSEAGFAITKEPGYTTIVNGDLLILVKCRPVNVELRQTKECYSELPITYNNRDVFLQSRTKIIVNYASEKLCSNIFTPGYEIDRRWYEKIPSEPKLKIMNEYNKPEILKPNDIYMVDFRSKYFRLIKSKSLDEVNQFSAQLMFQIDKPAIAEEIALKIIEESSSSDE